MRHEGLPPSSGQVADAIAGNWVDSLAPRWSRPYLRLSRADRPIGTWLLLLPCWWGALLAALSRGGFDWTVLGTMAGCAAGAWLMRGAGCAWNDIVDRDFDARVARTRSRPIPSGQLTVRQAAIWMCVQAILALCVLATFHPAAILIGAASLPLVCVYPFAKRFTWWPQIFLGLAFNWGALVAWAAVSGSLSPAPALLYLAGISWTLFYDTIYAHQDKEDDALIGVRSTARLFGADSARYLRLFLVVAVVLMTAAFVAALAPRGEPAALAVSLGGPAAFGWLMVRQIRRLDIDDPDRCLELFRSNREAGLAPALFLAIALLT